MGLVCPQAQLGIDSADHLFVQFTLICDLESFLIIRVHTNQIFSFDFDSPEKLI